MRSRTVLACSAALGGLVANLAYISSAFCTDARQLYRLGLELYDEREYESALEKFEQSFRAQASPNSKLYIARCLRTMGRTDEAIAAYEQAIRSAKELANQEAKYATTYQTALRELAVLRPPPPAEQRYVAATWVAAGIGAAGLASFGVFGTLARSRYASLEANCDPLPCPASEASHVQSGRDFQLLANVSLAIGLSGTITAVALYVIGRPRVLPYGQLAMGPNGLQIAGRF